MIQVATEAAIGFRSHSGWAELSILAGPTNSPAVVDRWRIELADTAIAGSTQPYHAAEELDLKEAEELISKCAASSTQLAGDALRHAIGEAQTRGYRIAGCGVLLASGKPLPELPSILASHALIHSAEGELFRKVIVQACADVGLPTTEVKEKELYARVQNEFGLAQKDVQYHLVRMGRLIGPPWRQDEKLATLAAWLALAATPRTERADRGHKDKRLGAHVR